MPVAGTNTPSEAATESADGDGVVVDVGHVVSAAALVAVADAVAGHIASFPSLDARSW